MDSVALGFTTMDILPNCIVGGWSPVGRAPNSLARPIKGARHFRVLVAGDNEDDRERRSHINASEHLECT